MAKSSKLPAARHEVGKALVYFFEGQGRFQYSHKDYKAAEGSYRQAVNTARRFLPDKDPVTGGAYSYLARAYSADGKHARAGDAFKSALPICEKEYGRDSSNVAVTLRWIAFEYDAQGEPAPTQPIFERVVGIDEHTIGLHNSRAVEDIQRLGYAYYYNRKYDLAERQYERALSITRSMKDYTASARILNSCGTLYLARKNPNKAVEVYKQALLIEEAKKQLDGRWLMSDLAGLGESYKLLHEKKKAEAAFLRVLREAERLPPGSQYYWKHTGASRLARGYYDEERYGEAEKMFRRMLVLDEKHGPRDYAWLAYDLHAIGTSCYQQKKYAEAEPVLERSLAIQREHIRLRGRFFSSTLLWLGDVSLAANKLQQAEEYYREGIPIASKLVKPGDKNRPRVALRCERYAKTLRKLGKPDEAKAMEAQARQIRAEAAAHKTN